MNRTLRIGTRGSALALAQAASVADALERAGASVQVVVIVTPGDRSQAASTPIAEVGIGVFTSALRDALAADEVDIAVHSFKDLPTAPDPRLVLAAVPVREDPRDVLVARDGLTLAQLPPGSRIGTGSPRRIAQIDALGLGLRMLPIRGNVDTRMRKVAEGQFDAVVLAKAGLARLGRLADITEILDPSVMLPAPAQGALAVECRVDDMDTEHLLRSVLDDQASRVTAAAERAMLAALEAKCNSPIGALAEVVEDHDSDSVGHRGVQRLLLRGVAATHDINGTATPGSVELVRASATSDLTAAEQLGRALAAQLLDLRAAALSGPGSK